MLALATSGSVAFVTFIALTDRTSAAAMEMFICALIGILFWSLSLAH